LTAFSNSPRGSRIQFSCTIPFAEVMLIFSLNQFAAIIQTPRVQRA
jgi:hypothetical protein